MDGGERRERVMAKRDILVRRVPGGWASRCGRVIATRDVDLVMGDHGVEVRRTRYWTVELFDDAGGVIDDESVDTLAEADDRAWWFANRVEEGRA